MQQKAVAHAATWQRGVEAWGEKTPGTAGLGAR